MMTVKPARKSKSQGQALVEFGLILPVLLLIVTGIIDFGQVAITYVQSLSALRNAARFAEVAGFATVPGSPVRYLDCDGMIDAANDVLFANQNIDITYHKADDFGNTFYDCDTVTSDVLRNGDILEIVSSARVQFITPFVSGIVPDLDIRFTARRTIIKSILLGSDDDVDTDYDGLLDEWELKWFGDLSAIATGDPDNDGCNNGCEEARDTCPVQTGSTVSCTVPDSKDSDADGLDDADEAYLYDTDGMDTDTDDDGLTDYDEVIIHKTDPNEPDTDGEGLKDGEEIAGIYDHLAPAVYPTEPLNPDTDGDSISDYNEIFEHSTDPNSTDTDGDKLSDGDEINVHHTIPTKSDSDDDGLSDTDEVAGVYHTNAMKADTDEDLLKDGDEVLIHHTRPDNYDTDADGLSDYDETIRRTDPNMWDTDGDGLGDGAEVRNGNPYPTNPLLFDTDEDEIGDGYEINTCGTDPTKQVTIPPESDTVRCGGGTGIIDDTDEDRLPDLWELDTFGNLSYGPGDDPDGDLLTNLDEQRRFGTNGNKADTDGDGRNDRQEVYGEGGWTSNPTLPDTDFDGLNDGQEVDVYGTNPNKPDTDDDGLSDPAELITYGTNPKLWDTDADALGDAQEIQQQTNPNNVDSDGDGLWDGEEVNVRGTKPLVQDTDGDGLNDYAEVYTHSTNPTLADTDGEGLNDGVEVNQYKTNPNKSDTDGDTLSDYAELFAFPSIPGKTTDPLVQDTDLDGKRDDFELANGTLPNNPIAISVLPNSVLQDNNGSILTVTIQLDRPSTETTKVRYRTADGTPPGAATVSGADYESIAATEITFLPGDTTETFEVEIGKQHNGNNSTELTDEHFYILLSDNDNAYISVDRAKMIILYNRSNGNGNN